MADLVQIGLVVDSSDVRNARDDLRDLGDEGGRASSAADGLSTAFKMLGGVLAGVFAGGFAAEVIAAASEIEHMARVANTTTEEFQRLAYGAKQLGINNEQLGAGLKDVNDKIGEFLLYGGGELKDFFERIAPSVGVTADQFRNLSGPDSMQLYISTLEKAGFSQAEMVHSLEAMADESARLIPLFLDGGKAAKYFADEADRMGIIMDDAGIKKAGLLSGGLDILGGWFKNIALIIVTSVLPVIFSLSESIGRLNSSGDEAADSFSVFGVILNSISSIGAVTAQVFAVVGKAVGGAGAAIMAMMGGNFSQSASIIKMTLSDIGGEIESTNARIGKIWFGGYDKQVNEMIAMRSALKAMEGSAGAVVPAPATGAAAKSIAPAVDYSAHLDAFRASKAEEKLIADAAADVEAFDIMNRLKMQSDAVAADLSGYEAMMATKEHNMSIAAEADALAKQRQLEAERGYWDELFNIQAGSMQAAFDFADSVRKMDAAGAVKHGAAMIGNLGKTSRLLFNIQKAAALANMAISLRSAVLSSFENGGGYPWGLIPAGIMLATGLQQIRATASTEFGGGVSGGGLGGGGGGAGAVGGRGNETLPPGAVSVGGDSAKINQKEIRVVFEGDNPHSDAMRKFATQLAETYKDMGSNVNMVIA